MELGPYGTNCYLAARPESSQALVVDPGDEPDRVLGALAERSWQAAAILVTHAHRDHIGAVHAVAEATGAPVYIPRGEADDLRAFGPAPHEPDVELEGGETVSAAGIDLATMLVPGHTAASIAYAADGVVFSGDVLFQNSVGRSDVAGGDHDTLISSIAAMARWAGPETIVLSGHGPPTTIGRELAENPFLRGIEA